jgi:hypothetical protein
MIAPGGPDNFSDRLQQYSAHRGAGRALKTQEYKIITAPPQASDRSGTC